MTVITLTTDFGLADPYVAMMKGVILGIAPDVRIVDISHLVPPQDIRAGAHILAEGIDYYPPGTIHVAVVDPGVGSSRRPVAARIGDFTFVGPDNGLLTPLIIGRGATIRQIVEPSLSLPHVATTFHGRDIFAPTAARLATGFRFDDVGPLVSDPVLLPSDGPTATLGRVEGKIVRSDRFGNLLTNIDTATIEAACGTAGGWIVEVGGKTLPFVSAYAQLAEGEAGVLVGSAGVLEIFVRNGNAEQFMTYDGKYERGIVVKSVK